ncbi:MAG: hypothetical protein HY897_17150 [Deltaproteobacteria bacterium]|nr:hypothetical protein [Deltaproteobacteria bacterium]
MGFDQYGIEKVDMKIKEGSTAKIAVEGNQAEGDPRIASGNPGLEYDAPVRHSGCAGIEGVGTFWYSDRGPDRNFEKEPS